MTREQARRLRTLITRKVKAELTLSWAGAGPPEDIPEIEARAKQASKDLDQYITLLTGEPVTALSNYLSSIEVKG